MTTSCSQSFGLKIWGHIHIMLLSFALLNGDVALSRWIVETLPGFSGTLPVKLETGYISVGDFDEVELFYYFFESEGNPREDPLMIWLTGGPGCSGLTCLAGNNGPLIFDSRSLSGGSLTTLFQNPYSIVKIANVIFIDSPVTAGFSYATTNQGYYSNDTKATKDATTFLRKWLLDHPEFVKNPLYVGGDSYAGIFVPMVTTHVSEAIEAGHMPNTNIQGYILGNPLVDARTSSASRVPYAHRMALISDEYFESAKSSCQGDYSRRDPSNTKCLLDLHRIDKCVEYIKRKSILDPKCVPDDGLPKQSPEEIILLPSQVLREQPKPCLENLIDQAFEKWVNDFAVKQALHVRNGTLTARWMGCNNTRSGYVHDVPSVLEYHKNLSKKGYRALVYSGDHDMTIPYIDTLAWIRKLNLSNDEPWRPWFVDDQVAGYAEKYRGNNGFSLTFVTIKGAGHITALSKPKETHSAVERWFANLPL